MSNQNSGDHSFLLCELAAILAMLASAPMAVAQNRTQPTVPPESSQDKSTPAELGMREPITFDHVYGNKRISIGAFSPTRITWLDDEFYIQRESSGWEKVSAKTGDAGPWYDVDLLKQGLSQVTGVSESDAERLASGAWIESLPSQGIVLFRLGERLIRSRLDGISLLSKVSRPMWN
jgi:hypothetical protein